MKYFYILIFLFLPPSLWAQDTSIDARKLCSKGELESCISHAYYRGFETEPKAFPSAGVKVLTSACKSKNSRACFALGTVHRDPPKSDLKKARGSFERACKLDQDPTRTSQIGVGAVTDMHGQPVTPASCVAVMEMDCAMNGLEACQAWMNVARRACPRQCVTPCDHVGLGGRPCCKEWSSDCEESRKLVDRDLKKVGQSIASGCFDWKTIPMGLRVELFVKPNKVLWSGVANPGEEFQEELACISAKLAALKFERLPGPASTKLVLRGGEPCDESHSCDESQSCVQQICWP